MIDNIWKELAKEATAIHKTGLLKRLINKENKQLLYAGLKAPFMIRTLILAVKRESLNLKAELTQPKGFTFSIEQLDSSNNFGLILSSSTPEYNDIFSAVAKDIYGRLANIVDQKKAVESFIDRVNQWQIFFSKRSGEGLSTEEQQGLYGELYFLKNFLIASSIDASVALRAWTGPRGRQHDFQFGKISVEVKTSLSKQHQKIFISGEQQLDESQVEKLFIYFLSLALIENGSETLPKLVDDIRVILEEHSPTLELFEKALFDIGYSDIDKRRYSETAYSVRESCIFKVADDFPRITGKMLPRGIGDLKYSVAIDACNTHIVEQNELTLFIKLGEGQ